MSRIQGVWQGTVHESPVEEDGAAAVNRWEEPVTKNWEKLLLGSLKAGSSALVTYLGLGPKQSKVQILKCCGGGVQEGNQNGTQESGTNLGAGDGGG